METIFNYIDEMKRQLAMATTEEQKAFLQYQIECHEMMIGINRKVVK